VVTHNGVSLAPSAPHAPDVSPLQASPDEHSGPCLGSLVVPLLKDTEAGGREGALPLALRRSLCWWGLLLLDQGRFHAASPARALTLVPLGPAIQHRVAGIWGPGAGRQEHCSAAAAAPGRAGPDERAGSAGEALRGNGAAQGAHPGSSYETSASAHEAPARQEKGPMALLPEHAAAGQARKEMSRAGARASLQCPSPSFWLGQDSKWDCQKGGRFMEELP